MRILIVTPAPRSSRSGNRVTARRWAGILRRLGHHVTIAEQFDRQRCDLLVTLHARKSFPSIDRFSRTHPPRPLLVALTGTDLYGDLPRSRTARESLRRASRLILLQADGLERLNRDERAKARVIHQSVVPPRGTFVPRKDMFDVCVVGHLRAVKDPFRAAMAARRLPPSSRIRILHLGAASDSRMKRRAEEETTRNPRYRWMGDVPRWKALRVMARSRVMVLSSRMEGGANVVSEAIATGVPILASRISGTIGLLGPDYPGYFEVGDTSGLAELLRRVETDRSYYQALRTWCRRRRGWVEPLREARNWTNLLREVSRP